MIEDPPPDRTDCVDVGMDELIKMAETRPVETATELKAQRERIKILEASNAAMLRQYNSLIRADEAEAARDKALADIENRERRRVEILDWLEEQIGTAWQCVCGHHMYNSYGPDCHECAREAPVEHIIAFKLHASHAEAKAALGEQDDVASD